MTLPLSDATALSLVSALSSAVDTSVLEDDDDAAAGRRHRHRQRRRELRNASARRRVLLGGSGGEGGSAITNDDGGFGAGGDDGDDNDDGGDVAAASTSVGVSAVKVVAGLQRRVCGGLTAGEPAVVHAATNLALASASAVATIIDGATTLRTTRRCVTGSHRGGNRSENNDERSGQGRSELKPQCLRTLTSNNACDLWKLVVQKCKT